MGLKLYVLARFEHPSELDPGLYIDEDFRHWIAIDGHFTFMNCTFERVYKYLVATRDMGIVTIAPDPTTYSEDSYHTACVEDWEHFTLMVRSTLVPFGHIVNNGHDSNEVTIRESVFK